MPFPDGNHDCSLFREKKNAIEIGFRICEQNIYVLFC